MSDLIVYDVEATDVDVRHGQITQFAALRANERNEVTSESDLRIRRLPYVVPAPRALEVTGTDPFELESADLPTEYEAAAEIEKILQPVFGRNQINLTFNGPTFDDEMLRTTLYRNMRSPWFSSGKNIIKVDMLSVIRLLDALHPGVVAIPTADDGRQVWRLEAVCLANGIPIDAHDALGDVRATFELARLVMQRAPEAWEMAKRAGSANGVEAFLAESHRAGAPVYLFTHFGRPEVTPCAVLGSDGKKKWILLDLRAADVLGTVEDIRDGLYSRQSPFRVIRSNSCPVLFTDQDVARHHPDIDRSLLAAAAATMKREGRVGPAAVEALSGSAYEMPESATSEERIYDGFTSDRDKALMGRFNAAKTWAERAAIRFSDDRLNDFAGRIVTEAIRIGRAQSVPEELARTASFACEAAMRRPHGPGSSRWMTIEAARAGGADERWEEWAASVLAEAKPSAPMPAEQLGFGF